MVVKQLYSKSLKRKETEREREREGECFGQFVMADILAATMRPRTESPLAGHQRA